MYMKEQIVAAHPCKQGFEKKGATQTDAENLVDADARREKLENTRCPLLRLYGTSHKTK